MVEILAHYELDNTILVENLLRNAQYAFQKKGGLMDYEQIFFKTMKQLIDVTSERERIALLTSLKVQLAKLAADNPIEAQAIHISTLKDWLNWKVAD